ncbi:hypothetical protein PDO_4837 [Rhizobium sp. PDO1-076]|nr:hypothetical protein PDO_4837 [Rhizobium sp. PDO1-076]
MDYPNVSACRITTETAQFGLDGLNLAACCRVVTQIRSPSRSQTSISFFSILSTLDYRRNEMTGVPFGTEVAVKDN